ncbi:hypothetical protein [Thermomicrobium sp.]
MRRFAFESLSRADAYTDAAAVIERPTIPILLGSGVPDPPARAGWG